VLETIELESNRSSRKKLEDHDLFVLPSILLHGSLTSPIVRNNQSSNTNGKFRNKKLRHVYTRAHLLLLDLTKRRSWSMNGKGLGLSNRDRLGDKKNSG
jgi:hypothetical protein